MKMPIAWHQQCLTNLRANLTREENEVFRMTLRVGLSRQRANEYATQIKLAIEKGKDGFDSEKFGKKRPAATTEESSQVETANEPAQAYRDRDKEAYDSPYNKSRDAEPAKVSAPTGHIETHDDLIRADAKECTCICHRQFGMVHCSPCCNDDEPRFQLDKDGRSA